MADTRSCPHDVPFTERACAACQSVAARSLPYERVIEAALMKAIRLFWGERLLVLQPFGWHIDGQHIPNAAEHFDRDGVCEQHGWYVVCDFGPYVAIVRQKGVA